jgi:hypothetical protein
MYYLIIVDAICENNTLYYLIILDSIWGYGMDCKNKGRKVGMNDSMWGLQRGSKN